MKKKPMEREERKKIVRTIKEAREYAENIVNTVREPLIVLNGKLRVISANKSFYNSFKVKPKETIGKLIYDLGNRQWNIPKLRKLLEEILPNNTAFDNFEVDHNFPNIGRRIMLLNARRIPRPPAKPRIILLAIEDITNKKMTQEALEESEEKFRQFFEDSNDAIFIADTVTRRLIGCNKKAAKLVGRSNAEILSMRADNLHPTNRVKETMEDFNKQIEGEKELTETEVLTKTGKRIPVEINANVVKISGKKYLLGIFRDITEREKMEEKVREQIEELKGLDELKTQFLSITSHELRTPMTPMKAQLQMLLEGYFGKLNEKQEQSLWMILRNTERLDKLIVDILDVSRIQAGTLKFELKKVQLADCIRESITNMKPLTDEKNIAITTKIDKLPKITTDKDRVTQVLINLIDNAIKFTPEKGKITIEAKKQKNNILVKVEDTGIGISEENLKRIFTPFLQIDSSYSRKYKGTGLGLVICKGIVEQYGGKILAKSKLGKGSTFYFTLPLRPRKNEKTGLFK